MSCGSSFRLGERRDPSNGYVGNTASCRDFSTDQHAALLWPALLKECSNKEGINIRKFFRSMDKVLKNQQQKTAIPRKFYNYIKDIWILQLKLHSRIGNQPYKLIRHPRFRAAFDFMLVRERAAKIKVGPGDWWDKFQKDDDALKRKLIDSIKEKSDEDSYKKFGFSEELR